MYHIENILSFNYRWNIKGGYLSDPKATKNIQNYPTFTILILNIYTYITSLLSLILFD